MPSSLDAKRIKYYAEYHSKIHAIALSLQVPPSGLTCRITPDAVEFAALGNDISENERSLSSIQLPSKVFPTRTTLDPITNDSTLLTLKLAAIPNTSITDHAQTEGLSRTSLSKAAPAEFPVAPLPAAELQGLRNIVCRCCENMLLKSHPSVNKAQDSIQTQGSEELKQDGGPLHRVVDLPSEHWQELVDCWMCHEEDFKELREGDLGARLGQALVGGTYLLIHASDVDQSAVSIESDARAVDWTRGVKRRWRPLACSRCLNPVGDGWYQSRKEDGTDLELIQAKFHKYMVCFEGNDNTGVSLRKTVPPQLFTSYVAAEIFEAARHHATYRFILQDRLKGTDMLLLWMVNWDSTILSNHTFDNDNSICWDDSLTPSISRSWTSEPHSSRRVMKVLYLAHPSLEKQHREDSTELAKKLEVWERWQGDHGVERLEFHKQFALGLLTGLTQSAVSQPPTLNNANIPSMEGMQMSYFEY
ncbi:hypothetical protein BGW38_010861 [Lunasporangiospora selenospora]|uniref:Uncharacterized protein n=1 Tax=Lunasporangiospora selenospora TaxID=979761 RepID=A0A9P6FXV0_9FUNG|nr:hypothetical protein BGW38_010861 [Lunasporangiospora selenospora]